MSSEGEPDRTTAPASRSPKWGRRLEDFAVGATYQHPWEVTVDEGLLALLAASFQDATPVWASRRAARAIGLRDRPIPPLVALNLALSFSVHDVSEQAIAHLAYADVRFPEAGYAGDTVSARSTVTEVKPTSSGDRGVVTVRTALTSDDGRLLCVFERKALIRGGRVADRPAPSLVALPIQPVAALDDTPRRPPELRPWAGAPGGCERELPGWYEDFAVGQRYLHANGRTVGQSEHMQLTTLLRNSHPIHFDEVYCKESSFARTRVVYGGLVFAWVASLTSRDLAGHALWEEGFTGGAHPAGVVAGDTLYAASEVIAVEPASGGAGAVTFKLVGLDNLPPPEAVARYGDGLFADELGKKDAAQKVKEKVFEIRRRLLIARRPPT